MHPFKLASQWKGQFNLVCDHPTTPRSYVNPEWLQVRMLTFIAQMPTCHVWEQSVIDIYRPWSIELDKSISSITLWKQIVPWLCSVWDLCSRHQYNSWYCHAHRLPSRFALFEDWPWWCILSNDNLIGALLVSHNATDSLALPDTSISDLRVWRKDMICWQSACLTLWVPSTSHLDVFQADHVSQRLLYPQCCQSSGAIVIPAFLHEFRHHSQRLKHNNNIIID